MDAASPCVHCVAFADANAAMVFAGLIVRAAAVCAAASTANATCSIGSFRWQAQALEAAQRS